MLLFFRCSFISGGMCCIFQCFGFLLNILRSDQSKNVGISTNVGLSMYLCMIRLPIMLYDVC